jgi:3-dehydroquinate dehydratase-2
LAAAPQVLVLNGPNLNMLGLREPEIYGRTTLADIEKRCVAEGKRLGLGIECRQSNIEGELVTWVQQARGAKGGIVINPGAYTHTSIALLDALKAADLPSVEVHLSNIHRREEFRRHSYVSMGVTGVIAGLGADGYILALTALAERLLPKTEV